MSSRSKSLDACQVSPAWSAVSRAAVRNSRFFVALS
jgi:hypothetical protein